ncbi:MAG TPA: DUF692 domain-containing protein [Candidatus Binataceae bacterium]|nr:DUF692 domain-containing protein [Candidatus Binataceae bacterium]
MTRADFATLGFGVGLRRPHYARVLETDSSDGAAAVDWFEIISENFMVEGGRPLAVLEGVRARYPVAMHGVGLSIGSSDPLNRSYLNDLSALIRRIEPAWVSDHLCWTGVGGRNLHDLLPLPYTEEAVHHVARRIRQVQDALQRTILIENVSSYMTFRASRMEEWEFVAAVAEEANCAILLDINNVFVNAFNHGFDPRRYVDAIPVDRVVQFHLAGHSDHGHYLLDTHDHPVRPEVWALYEHAVARYGRVPTLIEWDDHIPEFAVLAGVAEEARRRCQSAIAARARAQTERGAQPH